LAQIAGFAGLVFGFVMTGLGWLARWFPLFDLFTNATPFVAAGTIGLLVLALVTRDWRLILPAALLAAINVYLFLAGLQGAAPAAASGAERFLRVVTMNVWHSNDRIDGAIAYLGEADADVIVLQEMSKARTAELRRALGARYPHSAGDFGVVILSKFSIKADGRIDRVGYPDWMSPFARWVEIDVNGTPVEIVGVHFARPLCTQLQSHDAATVTQFLRGRNLPLIVAGDFNMTPWTEQLKRIISATGLKRYNTFHPTWPMRWRKYPVPPVFVIDHVLASDRFANISTTGGSRVDSDHRPVIADIALRPE
jgi:endonuclease/exonuclease/phosphatase (EEP) superfamily protein YafD